MTKKLDRVSHKKAMIVAMRRAIEWSQTLDTMDEEDEEWERQFRERCRRALHKWTKGERSEIEKLFDNAHRIDAFTGKRID